MKVTEVKYSKRFNLGNYEHEEFTVTAIVEEDADVKESLNEIKDVVNATQAGAEISENSVEKEDVKPKTAKGRGVKNPKKSQEPTTEGEEDEEEENNEEEDDQKVESEDSEEDAEVEEDEEEPKGKKAKGSNGTSGKRTKSRATSYSRVDDLHKKIVGDFLNEEVPGWNKKYKENALLASKKMNGKDFLDADGEVIESFKKDFLRVLKGK